VVNLGSTPGTGSTGTDRLGKQDFLQLLIAQLRNQDPMKPMEDREFISQMAQFSALEAMQNLDKRMETAANAQLVGQAAGLLGRQVQAKLADGTIVVGVVKEVQVVSGAPRLIVNGQPIELGQITTIEQAPS
jgi:flagellar basal-body rod modification protein FlgD